MHASLQACAQTQRGATILPSRTALQQGRNAEARGTQVLQLSQFAHRRARRLTYLFQSKLDSFRSSLFIDSALQRH